MLATEQRSTLVGREGDGVVAPELETNSLRVDLLGGFRVAYGDAEILDDGWRLAKARSLVKIVALAPALSIHREQLIDYLWPDLDPGAGTNNLHQALHVARRTLAGVIPDVKPNEILRLQHGMLTLAPPMPVWVDVDAFEAATVALHDSTDPESLYAALDLYQGELLPDDLYEDWAYDRRVALQDRYLSALDRLARLHYARREAALTIDALRRIVATEPDQEEAHRTLMELYALTGRRQQALRQYERLREVLARELEVEPDPETEALYQAIQSGEFPEEVWEEALPEGAPSGTAAPAPAREPPRPAPAPVEAAKDFVGRERELTRLTAAFQRAVAGRGEIALIAGEPGIGKTRMIEEFTRFVAAHGVDALWGSAYDGDGAPAYWPWLQIVRDYIEGRKPEELRAVMGPGAADIARIVPELRRALPDLEEPPPLDPDGERFRLFDSMTNFLQAASGRAPVILILDDVQWADRSSLSLLEFLAREVGQSRLLVIAAYRHVEVERGHPLLHALGELARQERSERITLAGLDAGQISRYIAFATGRDVPEGLAEAIQEQTEGNPFFVREIVRLLIDEQRLDRPEDVRSWRLTIPPGIRETIALRTDHLSDIAHRTLTVASVSGRDFELPIVAQVANLDELDALDALEEVLHTGLIEESDEQPGAFRFAHAIVRETLYDAISHARRLRMHLRTGEAIEDVYNGDADAKLPELASHFFTAASLNVESKALSYLRRAARQAVRQVAYAEAVGYLQSAAQVLSGVQEEDADTLCALLVELGQAQKSAGDSEGAFATFRDALDVAKRSELKEEIARATIGAVEALYQLHSMDGTSGRLLEEALAIVDASLPDLRARLINRLTQELAVAFTESADVAHRAKRLSDEAMALAEQLSNDEILLDARLARQWTLWRLADNRQRVENADAIIHAATAVQNRQSLLMGYAWRIHESVEAGDMEEARHDIECYGALAQELRLPHNLWATLVRRAMLELSVGNFDAGEAYANEALEIGKRSAAVGAEVAYFMHRFVIERERGYSEELFQVGARIAEGPPPLSPWNALRALALAEHGEREDALEIFARFGRNGLRDLPRNLTWSLTIAVLGEVSVYLADSEYQRDLYDILAPLDAFNISGGGNVICLGSGSYFRGVLASALGNQDAAITHLTHALDFNHSHGFQPSSVRTAYRLATVLLERGNRGDIDKAAQLLRQAQQICDELDLRVMTKHIGWTLSQRIPECV